MTIVLILLLITTVVVSFAVGFLAKLPPRDLAFQTGAMLLAALGFYGLTVLV